MFSDGLWQLVDLEILNMHVFYGTGTLEILNISQNKLQDLPLHVFYGTVYLEILNMSRNQLIHRLRDDRRYWPWVLSLHRYSGTSCSHFSPSVGPQSTVYCHILPPLQRLHPLRPLDTQLYHRLATALTHFPLGTHSRHHLFQDLGPGQSGSLFVCWGDQPTRDCSSIWSGVFLPQAHRWSPSG